MATLNKEAILGATDIVTETVHVPPWGGDVLVRGMTGKERGAWQQSLRVGRGAKADMDLTYVQASLCQLCLVDEAGKRLFSVNEVHALAEKSAGALEIVAKVAMRLSGLDDSDMESLKKDSTTTQS
jgi:hypothetical protein